jgi:dTDP-4-amino-4,6-dideoxygalactose transaminase
VPVFADVGSDLHLTPETVRGAITPRTKAVIVAHLFGKAAPVDRIEGSLRGTGIALIDDAAQSLGARCAGRLVGTFGACGIVSCGPGKALAGSAGGALVTHDAQLYERAASVPLQRERAMVVARRVAAFWLWRRFRRFTLPLGVLLERLLGPGVAGVAELPAPISNVEAAIALRQLMGLGGHAQERRDNAERLLERLGDLGRASILDRTPAGCAVKLALVLPLGRPSAAQLVEALAMIGIEAQGGYTPCHLFMEQPRATLPYAERVWRHVVCLPLETTLREGARLSRCLEDWRRGQSVGRQPVEGTALDTHPALGRLS